MSLVAHLDVILQAMELFGVVISKENFFAF